MAEALTRAGLAPVDRDRRLHGTGTRANDAMEDRAVHADSGARPLVSSTQGLDRAHVGACRHLGTVMIGGRFAAGLVAGCPG